MTCPGRRLLREFNFDQDLEARRREHEDEKYEESFQAGGGAVRLTRENRPPLVGLVGRVGVQQVSQPRTTKRLLRSGKPLRRNNGDQLEQIGDKLYATARAYVVDKPEDMPREMAAEFSRTDLNPGFVWIAGRYVQANNANRNGHFWTFDDLQKGEQSIRYTPMNVLHKWDKPVGTLVETKIVHREDVMEGSDRLLPEIQAMGVLWEFNFPEIAQACSCST